MENIDIDKLYNLILSDKLNSKYIDTEILSNLGLDSEYMLSKALIDHNGKKFNAVDSKIKAIRLKLKFFKIKAKAGHTHFDKIDLLNEMVYLSNEKTAVCNELLVLRNINYLPHV